MRSVIAAVMMALCSCERSEQLTDKYRYAEMTPGGTGAVLSGSRLVVYPDIVDYEIVGRYMIGRREMAKSNMNPHDPKFTADLGYFIFDMETERLVQGLSRQQVDAFRGRLSALGRP